MKNEVRGWIVALSIGLVTISGMAWGDRDADDDDDDEWERSESPLPGWGGWAEREGDDDDDDDGREEKRGEHYRPHQTMRTTGTEPHLAAAHKRYVEECGSCHLAYPARLLTAPSWKRVMAGLSDHFGESAELERETLLEIEGYLVERAGRMRTKEADKAPLRITETRRFRHEHHELSRTVVQDNPEVKSFSRCGACHSGAAQGDFDEHRVEIPGFGRWSD